MIVTIPAKENHEGLYKAKYEISDNCPKCGSKRGEVFKTLSYDGSRKMEVDGWKNPCGHIDYYSNVRQEGKLISNE